jgi:NTE family protein
LASKVGLVLTGGGARAAYQAGVMRGISAVLGSSHPFPFSVVSGISAGAINAGKIAAGESSFETTVDELCHLWTTLEPHRVLNTDVSMLTRLGTRWIRDLTLGGMLGGSKSTFLLDVRPLRQFLEEQLSFEAIYRNLQAKRLDGFAVSVTNYKTGTAISFFDGRSEIQPWMRSSRIGVRERLTLDHILASAAIPVLFPPVRIGETFYGDGSIRLSAPLSPAVHMGADKILAVGIRYLRPSEVTWDLNAVTRMDHITMADIAGVMLNATFFDLLDADVERMLRINQTLDLIPEPNRTKHPQGLRTVPLLVIRPSQDLGSLASDHFRHLPTMLRYMLSGIGASAEQGWDLLSYLAFDKAYTEPIVELGYKDALNLREDIKRFFD